MQTFWSEFATVALAHLLAVASPGPDFTIVTQHSLTAGRRTACWTSLGIGLGILVHVSYALLGIGWVMQENPLVFEAVKLAGAAYLVYLGIKGLRATRGTPPGAKTSGRSNASLSPGQALRTGFITNLLNPKATLFFVALFSVAVSPATPPVLLAIYGAWMSLATGAWFCAIASLFGNPLVRDHLAAHSHWIDRCCGLVLLALGLHLLITDQHLLVMAS